jgi:hypothetical protein
MQTLEDNFFVVVSRAGEMDVLVRTQGRRMRDRGKDEAHWPAILFKSPFEILTEIGEKPGIGYLRQQQKDTPFPWNSRSG